MHTLLDVLHVVAAVFIIGPLAILPMSAMRAVRAGQGPAVATLARSTRIFGLASLLVVVFGFGVMATEDPKYQVEITTSWIWISIVAYLIALGITLFAVVPAMRSAASTLAAGGRVGHLRGASPGRRQCFRNVHAWRRHWVGRPPLRRPRRTTGGSPCSPGSRRCCWSSSWC